jgi:hypothetical protein
MLAAGQAEDVRTKLREWPWLDERFAAHVGERFFNAHDQPDMRIRDLPPSRDALGADWAGAYLLSGDLAYARRAWDTIRARADEWVANMAGLGPTVDDLIGISIARLWRATSIAFDLVAGSDAVTDEERREMLRKLAFICEVSSTDDAWPRPETGIGRGNPNFHSDIVSARGIAAALLNGHPRQHNWMDAAVEDMATYMRGYHFESGCSQEAATYQLCTLNHAILLATAVRNAGGRDLFAEEPVLMRSFDYLASTQTPTDPRTGFCMLPTLGHVTSYPWCQTLQVYFAWAAKLTARSDPAFSQRMMAAWQRAGSMPIPWHDWHSGSVWWPAICLLDRLLPAEASWPPASQLHEGLGAILRTQHPEGDQGYLLVKMGASRGHYDPDEGSLIWYAYGQPLLTDFGCQYNPSITCAWLHNRVSIDHKNDWGSHFRLLSHQLTPEADYICGEMRVDILEPYPEWPIRKTEFNPRLLPRPHAIESVTWRRHVLYVHACEAIVLLDELSGDLPTDWNLQVFADEARIAGNRVHLVGQHGIDLDVYLAAPTPPDISLASFEHLGADEPRLPLYFWKGLLWTAPEGITYSRMGERALTLRARAEPGQDYVALLLARRKTQPPAQVSAAEGGTGFTWRTEAGEWRVRIGRGDGGWRLETRTGGKWRPLLETEPA